MRKIIYFLTAFLFINNCFAAFLLLPMEAEGQQNHLKAYGITYWALDKNYKVSWLLESRRYTPSSPFAIQTFCFLSSIINPVDVMGISIF